MSSNSSLATTTSSSTTSSPILPISSSTSPSATTSSPPATTAATSTTSTPPPTSTTSSTTHSSPPSTTSTSSSSSESSSGNTSFSTSSTSSTSVQAVPTIATSLSVATNANGGLTTVTVLYTTVGTPSASAGSATSTRTSSNNTGAIAGGAVGGVVGLALIALLLWFCIRKRKKDDFDGDFDPDRVVAASPNATLPRLDMDVTPYAYDPNDGGAVDNIERPVYDMAQRSDRSDGFLLAGAVRSQSPPFSDIQGNQTSTTGSHYPPSSSGHGLIAALAGDPRDHSSKSSSNALGSMPSSKEREASIDRRRLYVANEGYDRSGGSGDVIQHQDGGRIRLDRTHDEPQREIPPSYDSIGPDDDLQH